MQAPFANAVGDSVFLSFLTYEFGKDLPVVEQRPQLKPPKPGGQTQPKHSGCHSPPFKHSYPSSLVQLGNIIVKFSEQNF